MPSAEKWKPVPGWEGRYEVSDAGGLRRLARAVVHRFADGRGEVSVRKAARDVSSHPTTDGYLRTTLIAGRRRVHVNVHQLVARAFIGPQPSGLDVHHIDGDKRNNTPENLQYLPAGEHRGHRGEANPFAVLEEKHVRQIRDALGSGRSASEVASAFGVCGKTIRNIRNGRTWRSVA